MSLSMDYSELSTGYKNDLEDALDNAYEHGVVVFAPSGNGDNVEVVDYPASYETVIAVGALSPCNERKSASSCDNSENWSSTYGQNLDFLAPGVLIKTTRLNDYDVFNGTSAATPHAAGVAALMLSINPDLTPDNIRHILQLTAVDLAPNGGLGDDGFDIYTGYGRINAYSAVQYVLDSEPAILSNIKVNGDLLDGTLSLKDISRNYVFNFESIEEKSEYIILNENYTAETLEREGIDGLAHNRWNSAENYKFIWDNFEMEDEYVVDGIEATYKPQEEVTIATEYPVTCTIRDPWHVGSNGSQSGEDWVDTDGTYSVFLNQEQTPQNPNAPIYSLRAPQLYATTEGIFEFHHWMGTEVTFEESTSHQTKVVFHTDNAHVEPVYSVVPFDFQGLDIACELTIPAGAAYEMNTGFTFRIQDGGHLTIAGTPESPVMLKGSWAGIDVEEGQVNTLTVQNAVIAGAEIGVRYASDAAVSINPFTHVTFVNNDVAVKIEDSFMDFPEIVNCVFVNNGVALDLDLDECRIARQPPPDEDDDPTCWLTIHHSLFYLNGTDIEDHSQTGYYTINNLITEQSPLFVDAPNGDYHLQPNSPCIDAGDPESPFDPDGTIADIGTYYYQILETTTLSISGNVGDHPTLSWTFDPIGNYDTHEIWRQFVGAHPTTVFIDASHTGSWTDTDFVISRIDEEEDGRRRINVIKSVPSHTGFNQRVNYEVSAKDLGGHQSDFSNQVHTYRSVPGPIYKDTDHATMLPTEFALRQNYPNPFNPITTIVYDVPKESHITLTIYDLMGRVVNKLVNDRINVGTHHIIWNGTDTHGKPVASGMYLYQLKTDNFIKTKKLVLLN